MGILVSFAIPSYRHYMLKTHRQMAISDLLQIALLEERYHQKHQSYTPNIEELNFINENKFYEYYVTPMDDIPDEWVDFTFIVNAEAKNQDDSQCSNMSLDSNGKKEPIECWQA